MPLSTSDEREALERVVGKSPSASRWIALLTAAPTRGMTGAEITAKEMKYTGYARVKTTAASWEAATGSEPAVIQTGEALSTAEWTAGADEKATYACLMDAATEGNLRGFEKLEAVVTIGAGNKIATFPAKGFKFEIT